MTVASALSLLYVTFPNKEEALQIAHLLLEKRFIACANVLDPVTSVYLWEGQVAESQEVVAFFKTSAEKIPEVFAFIQAHHSYDLPAIIELPVGKTHLPFHEWALQALR